MSDRPKIGTGVFVCKDGKVLLGLRKGALGAGMWALPGGHMEFSETPEQTAIREVEEETGLRITNIRRLPYTNDVDVTMGRHYVTLFLAADWLSGEPQVKEPEKCDRWEWRSLKDIPTPRFLPLQNFLNEGHGEIVFNV